MTAISLSSYFGLGAMLLLTCNILLGLLISVRYSPVQRWPHRKMNIFALHNWTGYTAVVVAALHPLILLSSKTAAFSMKTVLWAVNAPSEHNVILVGDLAFYCLVIVVTTSYFRVQLGRRTWKALHYIAYISAALFYFHGIMMDPNLQNTPTDYLDGEKLLIEGCLLLVVSAITARIIYARHRNRRLQVCPDRS